MLEILHGGPKPANKSYGRLYIKTNHPAASTKFYDEEQEENGRSEAAERLLGVTVARLGAAPHPLSSGAIKTDGDTFDLF